MQDGRRRIRGTCFAAMKPVWKSSTDTPARPGLSPVDCSLVNSPVS
jgi:hypothetical protein